jgi:polyphosphate kinase
MEKAKKTIYPSVLSAMESTHFVNSSATPHDSPRSPDSPNTNSPNNASQTRRRSTITREASNMQDLNLVPTAFAEALKSRRASFTGGTPDTSESRPIDWVDPENLTNRELSWISFNERVLFQATRKNLPLITRATFLAITSSNLDEFMEVRVGRLRAMAKAMPELVSPENLTAQQQLDLIMQKIPQIVEHQNTIFKDDILPELEKEGIRIIKWEDVDPGARKKLFAFFDRELFPMLSPLAWDTVHPFSYVSNLSLNLGFTLKDPAEPDARSKFARVKLPSTQPRLFDLDNLLGRGQSMGPNQQPGKIFIPLEEIVRGCANELFRGMVIENTCVFRVTRHADLGLGTQEIEMDLRSLIEQQVKKHKRSEPALRLEIEARADKSTVELLTKQLGLTSLDVFQLDYPLIDLTCLWALMGVSRDDLKLPAYPPRIPAVMDFDHEADPGRMFDLIRQQKDLLFHFPYQSFSATVEAFIEAASLDPNVQAIKMTLYRTSDGNNPIIRSLIRASESGKQVVVLLELKARFNEESNVAWSKALENAGVHCVYGVENLKTHAKVTLVVRREGKELRRYVHASTGNYNRKTAGIYEDLTFFTCDAKIGEDAVDLFNFLTGFSKFEDYQSLLVAPLLLRSKFTALIDEQAELGDEGRIVIKCNSITDPGIIASLYRASQKGCWIDIIGNVDIFGLIFRSEGYLLS